MKRKLNLTIVIVLFLSTSAVQSKPRRPPSDGRVAVVVNEKLSGLRASPDLSGKLLQRLSRGRTVAIMGRKTIGDLVYYRVKISHRTQGWMQREALVSPAVAGDDLRLVRLIRASEGWDRIVRSYIFLTTFRRSSWRAEVLLIYGDAAEDAATRLSREATRRIDPKEIAASGAPDYSYFLNFNGLDRYNRQGIRFIFDRVSKRLHYDGTAWREIVRRYPKSPQSLEAEKRLRLLGKRASRPLPAVIVNAGETPALPVNDLDP